MVENQLPDQVELTEASSRLNQPSSWWTKIKFRFTLIKQLIINKNWHHLTEQVNTMRSRSRLRLNHNSPIQQRLSTMRLMQKTAKIFLGLVVFGIIGFFGLFLWFSRDLPKPGQIVRRDGYSTRIFDRNGVLLYDLYDKERRSPIQISQVPDYLKKAVVAIEDKDFYNECSQMAKANYEACFSKEIWLEQIKKYL